MSGSLPTLTTTEHDREVLGLKYVYAVYSRRAQGVSVGINLNPNNACNWRCIYCQVPNLTLGAAPPIDLKLLRQELTGFLDDIFEGDYLARHAPVEGRRLSDIAISGNGEPTTSDVFAEVVELIGEELSVRQLPEPVKVVLITNGSQVHKAHVLRGLSALGRLGGETWYKLDAVTPERRRAINNTSQTAAQVERNLALVAERCRVRIQTCVLNLDGQPPSLAEQDAYLELLARARAAGTRIEDVTLYGPERVSHQPEAPRIDKVDAEWLSAFAVRIEGLGLSVKTYR